MDKKKKIEIGLLAFIAVLAVCVIIFIIIGGKSKNNNTKKENKETLNAAAESESTEKESASEQESTSEYQKDYSQLRMDSYIEALNNIHDYMMLPDKKTFSCDDGRIEKNEFAIVDINNDGKEELLFRSIQTSLADMKLYVYGYDEDTESIYRMAEFYVNAKIYDNGYVKDLFSHNTGVEIDFWPYNLYRYDAANHTYIEVGKVETSAVERNDYADYQNGTEININYKYLIPQNYESAEMITEAATEAVTEAVTEEPVQVEEPVKEADNIQTANIIDMDKLNDLVSENIFMISSVFNGSPTILSNEKSGTYIKVNTNVFADYADFKNRVYSVYTKEQADYYISTGYPGYTDVNGDLYYDTNYMAGGGYYVIWDGYTITVNDNSDNECSFTVNVKYQGPSTLNVLTDYYINGNAVYEEGRWVLAKMLRD